MTLQCPLTDYYIIIYYINGLFLIISHVRDILMLQLMDLELTLNALSTLCIIFIIYFVCYNSICKVISNSSWEPHSCDVT